MSTAKTTSASVPDLDALRASLTSLLLSFKFAELIAAVLSLVSRMLELNLNLTGRLAQLTRKRPRSETLERLERQLLLPFGVAVTPRKPKPAVSSESEKPRTRPATSGRSAEFPEHLERVQVFNPLTPQQRTCPICGSPTKVIAHAPCERYNVIPARIVVEQRFDETRVCPHDETRVCPHDDTIVSAAAPPAIVERGLLGNELIIEATCDKFIEHLPIERQATRWHNVGAPISPATLGRGVSAHIDLLMPIANAIEQQTKAPWPACY
jgi:transposase